MCLLPFWYSWCFIVAQNLTAKLTDFRLTQKVDENGQYQLKESGSLPIRWMSPESLLDGIYSVHTDCWYVYSVYLKVFRGSVSSFSWRFFSNLLCICMDPSILQPEHLYYHLDLHSSLYK